MVVIGSSFAPDSKGIVKNRQMIINNFENNFLSQTISNYDPKRKYSRSVIYLENYSLPPPSENNFSRELKCFIEFLLLNWEKSFIFE